MTDVMGLVRFELEGGERDAHESSVENGSLVGRAEIFTFLDKLCHNFLSDSNVAHLSTLEAHNDSYLVTVAKKALRVLELGLKVVSVYSARKLYLLDLYGLLLLLC